MKRICTQTLFCLFAQICIGVSLGFIPPALASVSPLSYHGYLRSGAGANLRGGGPICLNQSGVSAGNEFRVGNECGTYGEATFEVPFVDADRGAKQFRFVTLFAYTSDNKTDWENSANPWVLREAYLESFATADVPVGVWAGKRFFRWGDIYFLDYFPLNWSGPGAGIHSISMPSGTAQVALTQNSESKEIATSNPAVTTEIGNAAKTMLHLRWDDADFAGGKTSLWLIGASTPSTKPRPNNGTDYKAGSGGVFAAKFYKKWQDVWSEFGIGYGTGVVASFGSSGELMLDCSDATQAKCQVQKSQRARFWNQWVYERAALNWQATFAGDWFDRGTTTDSRSMWLSAGIQPTYWVNERRGWFAGLGLSHVQDEADGLGARNLWRITVGPSLTLKTTYFSRPVLRAYYSYTGWSSGNQTQFASTAGVPNWQLHNIGFQGEVWF